MRTVTRGESAANRGSVGLLAGSMNGGGGSVATQAVDADVACVAPAAPGVASVGAGSRPAGGRSRSSIVGQTTRRVRAPREHGRATPALAPGGRAFRSRARAAAAGSHRWLVRGDRGCRVAGGLDRGRAIAAADRVRGAASHRDGRRRRAHRRRPDRALARLAPARDPGRARAGRVAPRRRAGRLAGRASPRRPGRRGRLPGRSGGGRAGRPASARPPRSCSLRRHCLAAVRGATRASSTTSVPC